MSVIDCRYFNGYKPCGRSDVCDFDCVHKDIVSLRILVIHLQAMGAVLRATSFLPALKRKYPQSHVTWVTDSPCHQLFQNNPWVGEVLKTDNEGLLSLEGREFDIAICVDKSQKATGILSRIQADQVLGFKKCPRTHSIIPANKASEELWGLGLSNEKKFFINQKPETQLMVEAFELGSFQRDEYQIFLSEQEKKISAERSQSWSDGLPVIGINIGCSDMIPYRKLSLDQNVVLIEEIKKRKLGVPVLLGGPSEIELAQKIKEQVEVIVSPMNLGVRDGLSSAQACDVIVSGDSFGMHMGIALKKWVVAWFGPTCAHEVDLYDRGVKVKSPVDCAPCWKRSCEKEVMCYDLVSLNDILAGISKGIDWHQKHSISKQPLLETSY